MSFFKKRSGALVIAIAAALLATVFGAHRSLSSECQKITDSFYEGVYDKDWDATRPSIDSQLNQRHNAANGLVSILNGYDQLETEAESLRSARIRLADAEGVQACYQANQELETAFDSAMSALEGLGASGEDLEFASEYENTFNNAQNVIDDAGYNEAVRAFRRNVLGIFPTNLLKTILGVDAPELFE